MKCFTFILALVGSLVLGQSYAQNSASFNGSARAYVVNPSLDSRNVRTIEMWVKSADIKGRRALWNYSNLVVDCDFWGCDGWMDFALEVGLDNGTPYIALNDDAKHISANSSISQGKWTHLAFNYDGKDASIYINGKYAGGQTGVNTNVWHMVNARAITFGASATGAYEPWWTSRFDWEYSRYFVGEMSDLRVWTTSRSQQNILANMYAKLGSQNGLAQHYPMNHLGMEDNWFTDYYYLEDDANNEIAWVDKEVAPTFKTLIEEPDASVWIRNDAPFSIYHYAAITSSNSQVEVGALSASVPATGGMITNTNEALFIARSQQGSGFTNAQVPSGLADRWQDTWHFIKQYDDNQGGEVHLAFNFADQNLQSELASGRSYHLLRKLGSGGFEQLPVLGTTINGNELVFNVFDYWVPTGEYTIGRSAAVPGRAVKFDGRNDYVRGPNLPLTGDFTLEFWAKSQGSGIQPLFTHDSISPNSGIYLELDVLNEQLNVQVKNQQFQFSNPFFSANAWGHYAISYQNATRKLKVYCNGYEAVSATLKAPYQSTEPFYLGMKNQVNYQRFLEGEIDEFRVWNNALSPSTIREKRTQTYPDGTSGLLRYHRFDQSTFAHNEVTDRSGQFVFGTAYQALTLASTAAILPDANLAIETGGKAIMLDGVNDYAVFDNIQPYNSTSSFTIEAQVKSTFTTGSHHGRIISQELSNGVDRFELSLINGKPVFRYENEQGVELARVEGSALELNQWHHLAVSYSNGQVRLMVDGIPVNTASVNRMSNGSGKLYIGGAPYATGEYFKGELDELRFWSNSRGPVDIITTKGLPLTGLENNLVSLFPFDFDNGNAVLDASGFQNHGQLHNSANQRVAAQWNSASEVNVLYGSNTQRTYKNGLRILARGFFSANSQDILASAVNNENDGLPAMSEMGNSGNFRLSRSWYITQYDDDADFSGAFTLDVVPQEMGLDLEDFLELDPVLLYKSRLNESFKEVLVNNVLVKDSQVVNFEIGSAALANGYYTLGFNKKQQGSAMAFSSNSSHLLSQDVPIGWFSIDKFMQLLEGAGKSTIEFWLNPADKPSQDVKICGFDKNWEAFWLQQGSGKNELEVYLKAGPTTYAKSITIAPHTWSHVSLYLDYTGTNISYVLRINGEEVLNESTNIHRKVFDNLTTLSYDFKLGGPVPNDTMKIDEFRVWDQTPGDDTWWTQVIDKSYSSSAASQELICYLDFNQFDGVVQDKSGNNAGFTGQVGKVDLVQANWPLFINQVSIENGQRDYNISGGLGISGGTVLSRDFFKTESNNQKVTWSHTPVEGFTRANLPIQIAGRLARDFQLIGENMSTQQNGRIYLQFKSNVSGIDTFYPDRTYKLLFREKLGDDYVDAHTYGTYNDHDSQLVFAVEGNGFKTGYYTMGWTSDTYDKAYRFNGNDQAYCVFENSMSDSFTVELWCKPSTLGKRQHLYAQKDVQIVINQNNRLVFYTDRLDSIVGTNAIKQNEWYHVAAVYDGAKASLWINQQKEQSQNRKVQSFNTAYTYVGLGKSHNLLIDELRTWKRPLDSAELAAFATGQLHGNEPGLTAYWRFNQEENNPTTDFAYQGIDLWYAFTKNVANARDKFDARPFLQPQTRTSSGNLTSGGLMLSNNAAYPFFNETGDAIALSHTDSSNAFLQNALGQETAPAIAATQRRWFLRLTDPSFNSGRINWTFMLDSMQVQHQASEDRTYYLVFSPTRTERWAMQPVLNTYVKPHENAVLFTTESRDLEIGYYGLAYAKAGWNHAVMLDGSNDFVQLGKLPHMSFADNAPFTVEAWLKAEGAGAVFSKTAGPNQSVMLEVQNDGYLRAEMGNGNANLISSTKLKEGLFNHLALVYDGDSMKLIVNGKRSGERAIGAVANASAFQAFIGSSTENGQRAKLLSAQVDELRIWNKALSHHELRTTALSHVMQDSHLVYNFRFNQKQENRSSNQHRATQMALVRNAVPNPYTPVPIREYVHASTNLRKAFYTGNGHEDIGGLHLESATIGNKAFLRADEDFIWAGHNNDSFSWRSDSVAEGIEKRWKRHWKLYFYDHLQNGGEVKWQFAANDQWAGPKTEYDYFLLFRKHKSSPYRLVDYAHYQKDLNQKKLHFRVDAQKLRNGYYTLGRATLGGLLTASDSVSDAHIYISYQVPAYCLQNIGGKPVHIEIENDDQQVVYRHKLDSFSLATAYADSFAHYVDANTTDFFNMTIYQVGPGTKICDGLFADTGSTKPAVAPNLSVDSTYLDRHVLTWNHASDHVNKYRVMRFDGKGDSTITFIDSSSTRYVDSIYGDNPPVNGAGYTYCVQAQSTRLGKFYPMACTNSQTKAVDFTASNNRKDQTVVLKWRDISAYADALEIHRDGFFYARLNANDSSFVDENPVFGKKHLYTLHVLERNRSILRVSDTGDVAPIGEITGTVRTLSGDYAVPNCSVSARARIDDSLYLYKTTTDATGKFAFSDVYFGTETTFDIVPAKTGHSFVLGSYASTLSAAQSSAHVPIQSVKVYETGNRYMGSFSLNTQAAENHNLLTWTYNTKAPTLFQVFRDDSLLDIMLDTNQFLDATVASLQNYQYRVNAYIYSHDSVTEKSANARQQADSLKRVAQDDFRVNGNNDLATVELRWEYDDAFVDGFVLWRDNREIAEVRDTQSFVDLSGLNGKTYSYSIAAFKMLNGQRHLSSTTSKKIHYPSLQSPSGIKLSANQQAGNVVGNVQYQVPLGYNYQGLIVKRTDGMDTVNITSIRKGKSPFFQDTSGHLNQQYTYFISAYKFLDSAESAPTAGQATFPEFPKPNIVSHLEDANALFTYQVKWQPNTAIYSGTQLVIDQDTALLPKGLQQQRYSVAPLYTGSSQDKEQYLQTFVWRNGQKVFSPICTLTTTTPVYRKDLRDIANFVASTSNSGFVRLIWEYPSYLQPKFYIYRDGVLLDSLSHQARSYNDFSAIPNRRHNYMIRAGYPVNNPTQFSGFAFATGVSNDLHGLT